MFPQVLYRCHADHPQWTEHSDARGNVIRKAKERVLSTLKAETGLNLDKVNPAGGKGGTSTTGSQGRRFFSEEVLKTITSLVGEKCRENLLLLHRQLSTILSVISSNREVDVPKYQELCNKTSMNICENFPWVKINHTLHGSLHHSVELITLNEGSGLGNLSEEGLEANNKDIRNYLQFLARKDDPMHQLTDVMSRLLERSDPCIAQKVSKLRPLKCCSQCGSNEHTARSHKRINEKPKSLYCKLVEDILLY